MKEIDLMEIGGFKVGHADDEIGITGCTVVIFDKGVEAGVDVRGGGPASRETPLLNPVADCHALNAILLSGGSAYGLDAAGGVMRYMEERGIGFNVGVTTVPLVATSCLFDLMIGDYKVRPDAAMAYRACENASYESVAQGSHGVGMGCTVGKYHMPISRGMKSGLGTYAIQLGDLKVGAMVAVNALGDIYDIDTNEELAGATDEKGQLLRNESIYFEDMAQLSGNAFGNKENTTLGIIFTNAKMDKTTLTKVAAMAHNGYGRAIRPVHTMADGDSIYAASVGEVESNVNIVGPLAAIVMGRAIKNALLYADSLGGVKAAKDLI